MSKAKTRRQQTRRAFEIWQTIPATREDPVMGEKLRYIIREAVKRTTLMRSTEFTKSGPISESE